jgi:hypothetical protein
MKTTDAPSRHAQSGAKLGIHLKLSLSKLLGADPQPCTRHGRAIKAPTIIHQGGISLAAHPLEDFGHRRAAAGITLLVKTVAQSLAALFALKGIDRYCLHIHRVVFLFANDHRNPV